ncbi:MAG: molybdenum ABC transporter ATP-binding protein [Pseudomonadota bacterium]|nr:molybdenum ABC transporter ATP-binding protein [Pseudomonadota bacterium]
MSGISGAFRHRLGGFLLDVDFALPGRGVTAIFGVSGSGKTSLLRCIAGLERAGSGQLVVNGEVWQDDAGGVFVPVHRRALGFVFQEASLFAHLDVQRNLAYGRSRVPAAQRRVSLEQAVELLGIAPLMGRRPDTLSGGERQRVAIARALATSPCLLLMDEPLAALDLQRKAEVLPYLEKLHAELEIPVLYVSHAPDEVARLADHLLLLEAGRVTAAGPTRELMTRLDLPLAHGDAAAAVLAATVTRLEPQWQLAQLEFPGGQISLPSQTLQPGQFVRVRIQARDVSLSLQRQTGSSVLNMIAATVTGLADDSPGQLMVSLEAGGSTLLARITRKSAAALALRPGSAVYAQVKGVAVLG